MFAIVVNEKGGDQKRLEFDKPEVTIGRVQGNDIILPKGNVSKRHSRIVLKDGKFIIVDLKSTNGTYVNGRKITSPLVVKGSDKIYIGDFILSIEEATEGAHTLDGDLAPPPPPRKSSPSLPASPTIPPPPPRRPTQPPEYQADSMAEDSAGDSEEDAADPAEADMTPLPRPPEPRPARPSAPAIQPAALPRPLPLPSSPTGARPPSRVDVPVQPRSPVGAAAVSRPASFSGSAAAPAASMAVPSSGSVRRPSSPVVPRRTAPAADATETAMRAKVTEVRRQLSARLASELGMTGKEVEADEGLWQRAENSASEIVDQLVADGAVPSGADSEALAKDVVAETLGLGPLEEWIADEAVREVNVARHDRVFVTRSGAPELQAKWFSSAEAVARVIRRLLARAGRSDVDTGAGGLIEARLDSGVLLSAALPPMAARGVSLLLRRPASSARTLAELVKEERLTHAQADALEQAVRGRKNILVAGPSASGRSTLLGALARVAASAGERLVSVEEGEELDLGEGAWSALVGRGPEARRALQAALALRPERLIVGDLRGAEALDLVGALAAGTEGALVAITAGSPRHALDRLASLARLASEAPSTEVLAAEIARGVQLVVQLQRSGEAHSSRARVTEIVDVAAGDGGAKLTAVRG